MEPHVVQLADYREQKARARIFHALEILYIEALRCLEDSRQRIDPEILDEFFMQVIADHLLGVLENRKNKDEIITHYHAFDKNLRNYLGHRLALKQALTKH